MNAAEGLAIDTQSLGQLKLQANKTPDKALQAAAQQFEAVFMNMMLKSMREATPQDGPMDNEQSKLFTGMLDQQLTQKMASDHSIGLADMLVKQLRRTGLSTPVSASKPQASGAQSPLLHTSVLNTQSTIRNPQSAVPSAFNAKTQQDFVNKMLPHALKASQASGVPPQLIMGQAALESGWGKRTINASDGSDSHNLFGIKAGAGWHGKVAAVTTTEYKNGVASKQVENFRAYSSYTEAFNDYAGILSSNPRYANVMQQSSSPADMAQALQKSGYATDPKYAEKLVSIMKQMNLG